MWFNVQWKKLAILLTPTFLRSELMIAWLELLMESINDIHYQWLQFRKSNIYILAHNSQVCFLRGALNDRFDNEQRRIQIIDGNKYQRKYIYTDEEQKPRFLGIIYIHGDEDYSDTGVDFIVEVPNDIIFNINEMKGLIDFYKLASKRYKIVIL